MNRLYEGMFLLDANETARRWSELESHVGSLLSRVDAELQYAERWPDQRLAYEVKGAKKGTYYLTYFRVSPDKIQELRRDAELSEHVLRLLVIQETWLEDEMTQRQEAASRRAQSEPPSAPASEAPVSDAPVSDAPVSDAPVSDAPVSDAPGSDTKVSDRPEVAPEPTVVAKPLAPEEIETPSHPPTEAPSDETPAVASSVEDPEKRAGSNPPSADPSESENA